jgi:hypothetical protein
MPRRNSNALTARTRDRSGITIRAIRTQVGITYVRVLSTPSASDETLVLMDGHTVYVPTRSLIRV